MSSVSVDIAGLEDLAAHFGRTYEVMEAAREGMRNALVQVANYIVDTKLSGQVLSVQSGRLAESVLNPPEPEISGTNIIGEITSVFYGGIQEEGALIDHNVPVESSSTGFRHIDSLEARPWLEPSLREKMDVFEQEIGRSVMTVLRS